jgi:hypothetical protein
VYFNKERCLPSGSNLSKEDIERVNVIREVYEGKGTEV